jgi:hypothetical protein
MKKIFLIGAIVAGIIILAGYTLGVQKSDFAELLGGKNKTATITPEEAKIKALKFIEEQLVQPGTKVEMKEIVEEGDLYKLTLGVGGQDIPAYITKDGKKFFPQVYDIDAASGKKAAANAQPEEPDQEISKADKPTVDLYVMSFCPYGNKAEDTLKSAYDLLKNKVNFNFRYIVSSNGEAIQSLHGQKEVDQNEREACVMKNYGKDKWMDFVSYVNKNCGADGACWEAGVKSLNLDTAKISSCVTSSGTALMQNDEKLSKEAGASGSPTMIINGVKTKAVYKYGDSESYKQIICGAFNNAPAECEKTLNTATSTTEGGSCN